MKQLEIFVLFVFLSSFSTILCFEILTPNELAGHYIGYGIFWGKSPHTFNFTGRIVQGNPSDGCSQFKNDDEIFGNIVLIDKDDCYPQEKMDHAQKAGAIGAIISAYDNLGQLNYVYDGKKHPNLNISTLEISIDDYKKFHKYAKDSDENVTVVFYPTDDNPFAVLFSQAVWIPWMVLFIPWQCALLGIASWKLYCFIRHYGFELSITQGCLILLIISRLPLIAWCFDPNTIFHVYPDWLSTNLQTSYSPFAVGAYLLLSFYWQELSSGIKQFNNVMPKLDKMKIPFTVLFTIILGLEVGGWVPRALNLDTEALTLMIVVISSLTLIGCTIFYFIQAHKILRVFRKSIKLSNKTSNLKRVTILVVVTGSCWLAAAVVTASLGLQLDSVNKIIAIYWVSATFSAIASTCMILIFTPPKGDEKSSSEVSMQQTQRSTVGTSDTTNAGTETTDNGEKVSVLDETV